MNPLVKTVMTVAVVVVLSDIAGNKIANKLVGPETTKTDKYMNEAKVWGAKIGVGVGAYFLAKALRLVG